MCLFYTIIIIIIKLHLFYCYTVHCYKDALC